MALTHCVHFTGIQNGTCGAGVTYQSLSEGAMPCIRLQLASTCTHRRGPTPEEIEKERQEDEAFNKLLAVVTDQVNALRKAHGKGWGGQEPCQGCQTGTLSVLFSSYNGHARVSCSTPNCVRWIE